MDDAPFDEYVKGKGARLLLLLFQTSTMPNPLTEIASSEISKYRKYLDTQISRFCLPLVYAQTWNAAGKQIYSCAAFLIALGQALYPEDQQRISKLYSIRRTVSKMLEENRIVSASASVRLMMRIVFGHAAVDSTPIGMLYSSHAFKTLLTMNGYTISINVIAKRSEMEKAGFELK